MSMLEPIETTDAQSLAPFDAIIDVRSPAEFAEDHIPGAINLAVLSDAERAEVGTIYKQISTFKARRIGAALISRNAARHLEEYFADKAPASQFLIYCWRGGMRSGSMATIVSEVGWRTSVLKGGYKTWRRKVVHELRDSQSPLNIVLLDGQTGSAKSEIIVNAAKLGLQTLDLEALARHRGSVFGALVGTAQPSQKHFESLLWDQLSRLDLSKPILVEAESSHIGKCEIPSRLWRSMQTAKHIVIEADITARAKFLVSAYRDMIEDVPAILSAINRLTQYHSKETIGDWRNMVEAEEFSQLAEELMREHYDPLYSRSSERRVSKPLAKIPLGRIDDVSIAKAAEEINSIISNLPCAE
ncbi:MAG: tRNA 2-selenouridine(34) synthase MnmH [Alphaproteobacteria bacterium]|nr:tRNA 2-selenouridine(34) synthase MnmH [Alphaproteobacteria bacterium]